MVQTSILRELMVEVQLASVIFSMVPLSLFTTASWLMRANSAVSVVVLVKRWHSRLASNNQCCIVCTVQTLRCFLPFCLRPFFVDILRFQCSCTLYMSLSLMLWCQACTYGCPVSSTFTVVQFLKIFFVCLVWAWRQNEKCENFIVFGSHSLCSHTENRQILLRLIQRHTGTMCYYAWYYFTF